MLIGLKSIFAMLSKLITIQKKIINKKKKKIMHAIIFVIIMCAGGISLS